MNSRERLLSAIQLQTPDRVPCAPHVGPAMVEQMTGAEWEALCARADVTMSVGALGDAEIFGGQYWLDHAQVTREGDQTVTRVETPKGELRTRQIRTSEATWVAEHYYKAPGDVEKLLSVPYEPPSFEASAYRTWKARVGEEGLVALGIPSAFRFCLGFFGSEALYLAIADQPKLVEDLVATMNERLALYIKTCCGQGVRSFWMGGSEHCGPGVVHPRVFRRMVTPYDRRIVAIIHDHGGIVNYHTHGKLRDILDEIIEIGVDVMSPIETGLRGDVTLGGVKARVGDRVCLKGNIDDMAFLAQASPQEVRAAAEACIAQAAAGGGYILSGTDAGIYTPHWVQSFLLLAEAAAQHRY